MMEMRRITATPGTVFESPLIIYKITSEMALRYSKLVVKYLLNKQITKNIYVQKQSFNAFYDLTTDENCDKLAVFNKCNSKVDLCIVIGGDGTVLWCNNMFPIDKQRPPFLTFNLGTLGYMTYYDCDMYRDVLEELLNETSEKTNISYEKRSTLFCKFISVDENDESESENSVIALNDIVIERGDETHLVSLEIYINNEPLTNVKGDGLIISTSTGSTAYSLSAGGSIIHYDVDCLLLNAKCPHSLSFRALVFPRDINLKVIVSQDSYPAWVVNDGINRVKRKIKQGIEVSLSDKFCNMIIIEKFISLPIKVWRAKLIDQLGWNSSFKNVK